MQNRDQYIENLSILASFLVWYETVNPHARWGGRHIREAVNALAKIMGTDPATLRERLLLDPAKPGDDRHD